MRDTYPPSLRRLAKNKDSRQTAFCPYPWWGQEHNSLLLCHVSILTVCSFHQRSDCSYTLKTTFTTQAKKQEGGACLVLYAVLLDFIFTPSFFKRKWLKTTKMNISWGNGISFIRTMKKRNTSPTRRLPCLTRGFLKFSQSRTETKKMAAR